MSFLSPPAHPPPCTRITTGCRPGPEGTLASSLSEVSPALPYSMSGLNSARTNVQERTPRIIRKDTRFIATLLERPVKRDKDLLFGRKSRTFFFFVCFVYFVVPPFS